MEKTSFKLNVTNAIAYSRLISKTFTEGECILLHVWKNQGVEPNILLKNKYSKLLEYIKDWQRPEMKYDEGSQLYYECPDTLLWKKVINN